MPKRNASRGFPIALSSALCTLLLTSAGAWASGAGPKEPEGESESAPKAGSDTAKDPAADKKGPKQDGSKQGSSGQTPTQAGSPLDKLGDRYKDGFILVSTDDSDWFPFMLKLNNTTQFRYINTQPESDTFIDHTGAPHDVNARNDFSVNRSMFTFGGFVFDRRLKYSLVTWTSNTLASAWWWAVTSAGSSTRPSASRGWLLDGPRHAHAVVHLPLLHAGRSQPCRQLLPPRLHPGDLGHRRAAEEDVNYHVFLGNGLNTLTIATSKFDTNLLFSGTVSWEPLGPYGPAGKARNMYDDYYQNASPMTASWTMDPPSATSPSSKCQRVCAARSPPVSASVAITMRVGLNSSPVSVRSFKRAVPTLPAVFAPGMPTTGSPSASTARKSVDPSATTRDFPVAALT